MFFIYEWTVVHQGQLARDKIEGEVVKYMYDSIGQPTH
jgi:hypothetical protein